MKQFPKNEILDTYLLNMAHVMELISESGWLPKGEINIPPDVPLRLCAWEP